MARFDDYHRTVIGYHGTNLSSALRIVNRIEGFRWSRRNFDWLGHGIYFWEYAPEQAMKFAQIRKRQFQKKPDPTLEERKKATEPIAVVASMIRLGFCFDLLDPFNVKFLEDLFEDYRESKEIEGETLPKNNRRWRKLDCAVLEYAYQAISESADRPSVDTARGVYVPTGGNTRIWKSSWISRDTHIQLSVRNPASILGTWLYYPANLEARNASEAIEDAKIDVEPDHPPSVQELQTDDEGAEDRPDGKGEGHDAGRSREGEEEVG
jgi:hypothetical protein